MLILIICILINAFLGVIFKYFEKYKVDNLQAIVVNYIVCVLTAAVIKGGSPIPTDLTAQSWFPYAFVLGIVFFTVFNTLALSVQHFGLVIASIFQKMSLLAPTLIAILVYGEPSNFYKWLGIALALPSIILLSYEKPKQSDTLNVNRWLWIFPIFTFLGSCLIDSGLYFIEKNNMADSGDIGFVASLFLFTSFFGLIFLIVQLIRGKSKLSMKNILAGIILGVPNFFSIYLLLLALQTGLGGAIVFPVNNVGILIMAAIFGILFFREKLTKYRVVGFALSITAILLISLN